MQCVVLGNVLFSMALVILALPILIVSRMCVPVVFALGSVLIKIVLLSPLMPTLLCVILSSIANSTLKVPLASPLSPKMPSARLFILEEILALLDNGALVTPAPLLELLHLEKIVRVLLCSAVCPLIPICARAVSPPT